MEENEMAYSIDVRKKALAKIEKGEKIQKKLL